MTDPKAVTISIAAQLSPLHRPDGEPFGGDLKVFAESMCAYVAQNLERFADLRGGDSFVAVSITRGEQREGGIFRSGHYVDDKDTKESPPTEEPT